MPEKKTVRVSVNGARHDVAVAPRTLLADLLREEFGLTGTHLACEQGVCGACTVLVDGHAARSCLMLAVQAEGAEILTIEGVSPDGNLTAVQQAFQDNHGMQCGFCTSGFVVSLHGLLQENPDVGDPELMDVLGGHLCRCTGYQNIVKAARQAAAVVAGSRP